MSEDVKTGRLSKGNTKKAVITEYDAHLFKEGNHFQIHEKLGAHQIIKEGTEGTYFSVWAPNAARVYVIGNFNDWNRGAHPLELRKDGSGIWESFVAGVGKGALYKYHIVPGNNNIGFDKGDPFALYWEVPPKTASVVWDLAYGWQDKKWMGNRGRRNSLDAPFSIYEVHLGSWKRAQGENNRPFTYREMAHALAEYVTDMGFTHVEFLPVMEHPFDGSWGYQVLGYFAPTSRYGTPQDFMYLVDYLHQHGIGVILDWVPSHFPSDRYGLACFDGTYLFEHEDPQKGFHPEWKSCIFNYGRNEVRNFLISGLIFWLDKYHIDGFRVDAVASMLYLDYGRQYSGWTPNEHGGRENLEAVAFLKHLNEVAYSRFPDVQIIAEESTAWPMVSRPASSGGLGFGMKWNMGWMHDILEYMKKDPLYRKSHHNKLTFSMWYAFYENFLLPLSHDEVVHGKGSLIGRMPGDDWQKFANLRLLYGFLYTHPGKKLLFMGGEFGQRKEWDYQNSLDWCLLQYPLHKGIQDWARDLNRFYRNEPALYELDFESDGFKWVDIGDWGHSIISFMRKGKSTKEAVFVACNFTPVPHQDYRIGAPSGGTWSEVLNSDSKEYGGSGVKNQEFIETENIPYHGMSHSFSLTLPPLGIIVLKRKIETEKKADSPIDIS